MEAFKETLVSELGNETAFTIPVLGGIPVAESVVVTWIVMAVWMVLALVLSQIRPKIRSKRYSESTLGWNRLT